MTRAATKYGYAVFTMTESALNEGWDILGALPRR
jgi:hypothetical protein